MFNIIDYVLVEKLIHIILLLKQRIQAKNKSCMKSSIKFPAKFIQIRLGNTQH